MDTPPMVAALIVALLTATAAPVVAQTLPCLQEPGTQSNAPYCPRDPPNGGDDGGEGYEATKQRTDYGVVDEDLYLTTAAQAVVAVDYHENGCDTKLVAKMRYPRVDQTYDVRYWFYSSGVIDGQSRTLDGEATLPGEWTSVERTNRPATDIGWGESVRVYVEVDDDAHTTDLPGDSAIAEKSFTCR